MDQLTRNISMPISWQYISSSFRTFSILLFSPAPRSNPWNCEFPHKLKQNYKRKINQWLFPDSNSCSTQGSSSSLCQLTTRKGIACWELSCHGVLWPHKHFQSIPKQVNSGGESIHKETRWPKIVGPPTEAHSFSCFPPSHCHRKPRTCSRTQSTGF